MAHILVVDDDPSLIRALRLGLRASGHEVSVATTGEQGFALVTRGDIDIVILDLGLPDIDGLAVCRRIREWSEIPIVVLSANDTEQRKVAALNEGADDYVTKPFGMAELEARIRTAIRHNRTDLEPDVQDTELGPLEAAGLALDVSRHEMRVNGAGIGLTSKEFEVMAYLMRHFDKVCTHQMILSAVWGTPYTNESQYLHVYINRLRHKIGDDSGLVLKTIPGVGYVLTKQAD